MPRSVKQIQEAVERKKAEILALEAAATAAAAAEEAKRNERQLDHQSLMVGRLLLDPNASDTIRGLQKRVLDEFTPQQRADFAGPPPEPVRTPRKAKPDGEAPKAVDPVKPTSVAA